MLPSNNIQSIIGATIFGRDKVKLGRISQVFVDAGDGHPTWAETHTGVFGRHTTYVPLHEATWEHDDIHVPYDEETVKKAPRVDGEGGLDPEQEEELRRHYAGVDDTEDQPASDTDAPTDAGADASDEQEERPDRDEKPVQHIDQNGVLWEERVVVTTEQVPVARLHRETTTVTQTPEVSADVRRESGAADRDDTRGHSS